MDKKKAVIFDFDGTLINSFPLIFDSFNAGLKEGNNQSLKEIDITTYFGPTELGSFIKIYKDEEVYLRAYKAYLSYYYNNHDKYMPSLDKTIIDIFEFLKNKNIDMFIVTGRSEESLLISMEKFGIKNYFKDYYPGSDLKSNKVESFNKLLSTNKYNKDEVVYVGDNLNDIKQCREVGIDIISTLAFVDIKKDEIIALNGDNVIYSLEELKSKIEGLVE